MWLPFVGLVLVGGTSMLMMGIGFGHFGYGVTGAVMLIVGIIGYVSYLRGVYRRTARATGHKHTSSGSYVDSREHRWRENRQWLRNRNYRLQSTPEFSHWLTYFRNGEEYFTNSIVVEVTSCIYNDIIVRDAPGKVSLKQFSSCREYAIWNHNDNVYYINDYIEGKANAFSFFDDALINNRYKGDHAPHYCELLSEPLPDDEVLFEVGAGELDVISYARDEIRDVKRLAFMTFICEAVISMLVKWNPEIPDLKNRLDFRCTDDVHIFIISVDS